MNPASLPPSHPQPAFPNPAPQACSSTGHTLEQSTESLKAWGGGGRDREYGKQVRQCVGCGSGGWIEVEPGALGRRGISQTSMTLGGALLASSQRDHRTVLHAWTQPRCVESRRLGQSVSPEIQLEGWPQLQPCSQYPSQATQAGGSQAPRCFGIWRNSSEMRWCTGCQAPPQGLRELGRE